MNTYTIVKVEDDQRDNMGSNETNFMDREEVLRQISRMSVQAVICDDIQAYKKHIMERCVQNVTHTTCRYAIGKMQNWKYIYWLGAAGDQGTSTSGRPCREKKGGKTRDSIRLHKFHGALLDQIPNCLRLRLFFENL